MSANVPSQEMCGLATYPEHLCTAWNTTHYLSAPEYTASQCGICGRITGFRWRRWHMRLFGLFSSQAISRNHFLSDVWWTFKLWWRC